MHDNQSFSGFPEGPMRLTPVPNLFFSDLLPAVDHIGELKITLYAFWALSQKEGRFQYLRREEMAADELLLQALETDEVPGEQALDEVLARAVARGTLLKATLDFAESQDVLYVLNTPKGRAAIRGLERGEWKPSGDPQAPVSLQIERPNIFALYEQNIGPLTPMIAERLRLAEREYPTRWLREAMQIAVENNVRKWRYVEAILEDWKTKGRDEREDLRDTEEARRRYLEGELGD
jgi:DnaD/phage-associated family protein